MAKIRQFWLVAPLDIKEDPNNGNPTAFEQAAVRPARNRNDPEPVVERAGYGFGITTADLKRMNKAYTTQEAAEKAAQDLAESQPKTVFGVFGCTGTFETTTPTVIRKAFNEDGELTPIKA